MFTCDQANHLLVLAATPRRLEHYWRESYNHIIAKIKESSPLLAGLLVTFDNLVHQGLVVSVFSFHNVINVFSFQMKHLSLVIFFTFLLLRLAGMNSHFPTF